MNIVVLQGHLPKQSGWRLLPNGEEVAELDVSVRSDAGTESVNVSWPTAKTGAVIPQGTEVVVVGRVRRRFFRAAGGATVSKTEVVAEAVVPARQAKRAATAVDAALRSIGTGLPRAS